MRFPPQAREGTHARTTAPEHAVAAPVAVVSLVYEQAGEELSHYVARLGRLDPPPVALYLVNNEPGRPVAEEIAAVVTETPAVHVIETGSNLGFARGVNEAAQVAACDGHEAILILNTDVEILADDLASRLLSALTASGSGFVSPGILCWPGTDRVWYRGAKCHRPAWVTRHPGIGRPWGRSGETVVPTDVGCSCCMLVSAGAFNRLGGFEERLFMYFEDAELAARASAAGIRTMLLDEPLVAHHKDGRRLSSVEAYFFARNPLLLIGWHERGLRRVAGTCMHLAAGIIYLSRAHGRGTRTAFVRGLRDGLAGRDGPPSP
ncbi:MAG: glycosyltransferase family 2 protein [Actinomycetota bacterium]|nr:glycosyltransferase family 2 protein [Actinomycetota bacterium]